MRFALLALLAVGCTRPNLDYKTFDLSSASDLARAFDLAGVDLARPDLAVQGNCVRVNEVMLGVAGQPGNEFVEVLNFCNTSIRIDNWRLLYRSLVNNGGPTNLDTLLFNFGGFAIPARGYALFAGAMYAGSKDGNLANPLSSEGGGVALVDAGNLLADSVAYGPVIAHNYTEGSPAPLPPAGSSLARSPDGADRDNNATDFRITSPTPRASN